MVLVELSDGARTFRLRRAPTSGGPAGQFWDGVLDTGRAIDWSGAGVEGGIPSATWSICQTETCDALMASGTISAATIETALSGAPANSVVQIRAGTFTISDSGITIPSNRALRGQGASQTILNFTNSSSFYWGGYLVGFTGSYDGNQAGSGTGVSADLCKGPAANLKDWTGTNGSAGTYTKGATRLDLSAVTGSPNLAVGDLLFLYQSDDADADVPMSNYFVSSKDPGVSREGSGNGAGLGQKQAVHVTAINGTQVTVTPGIYFDNWRTGQSPKAFWWGGDTRNAGLEDVSVATTAVETYAAVAFHQASDVWVRGVRVTPKTGAAASGNNTRAGFWVLSSRGITVQDSFLTRMVGGGASSTTSYGFEVSCSSRFLSQNNIILEVESPTFLNTGASGNVIAYTYEVATTTVGNGQTGLGGHEVGSAMNLFEGNNASQLRLDNFHGSMGFYAAFRNRWRGNTGDPPVDLWSYNRNVNIVGNVMGTSANQDRYKCDAGVPDTQAQCDRFAAPGAIMRLGYPGGGTGSPDDSIVYDADVKNSAMLWGNYDVVNAVVRWESSEVPTSAQYSNAVPSSQALRSSWYRLTQPSAWATPWGTPPWPPMGPDVTGGDIAGVGGHANKIPAQLCYENISPTTFSSAVCYP